MAAGLIVDRGGSADADADAVAAEAGPVDVGFLQDMSLHHEQAVTMGELASRQGADPEVQRLGSLIAGVQEREITKMATFMEWWSGKKTSESGEPMIWMSDSSHRPAGHASTSSADGHGGAPMPGMATEKELAKLRGLSGPQFDVYFLQLMLRHHQGGVPMAEYAYRHANLPVVRRLALEMLESQGDESRMMTRMLNERGATPLPR